MAQHTARPMLWSSTRTGRGETATTNYFFWGETLERSFRAHPVTGPVSKTPVRFTGQEGSPMQTGISCVIGLPEGGYRAYASTRSTDQKRMCVTVWDSTDGLEWHPVPLGQDPDGNLPNRVVFDGIPGDQSSVGGPSVVPLRDGRWRMYVWKHREGHLRYIVAESEDGLRWRVPDFDRPALYHPHDGGLWKLAEGLSPHEMVEMALPEAEVWRRRRLWTNDASRVWYDEHRDVYVCYSVWLHPALPDRRVDVDNAPGVHRLLQRRLSEDGLTWSDPELVLMPDGRDPWDLQFYFLNVQWHQDFLIGCLGYYRVEESQQTMDTELCFSRDGVHWERPVRGAWIPRSPADSGLPDTSGIYVCDWLDRGDRWLCLYDATPHPHNSRVFECAMMGAFFPRNRFAGVAATAAPAGLLTEPLFLRSPEILLDASIRGWLRAELTDCFGRKLPGFEIGRSVPLSGDNERHSLTWKDCDLRDHLFQFVRLRLEWQDGELWSVQT